MLIAKHVVLPGAFSVQKQILGKGLVNLLEFLFLAWVEFAIYRKELTFVNGAVI